MACCRSAPLPTITALTAAATLLGQEPEVPRPGELDVAAVVEALGAATPGTPLKDVMPRALTAALPDPPDVADAAALLCEARTEVWNVLGLSRDNLLRVVGAFLALDAAAATGQSIPGSAQLELLLAYDAVNAHTVALRHPTMAAATVDLWARALGLRPQELQPMVALAGTHPLGTVRNGIAARLLRYGLPPPQRLELLQALGAQGWMRPEQALACAEAAVRLGPEHKGAWMRLAHTYLQSGDLPRARAAHREGMRLCATRPATAAPSRAQMLAEAQAWQSGRRLADRFRTIAALEPAATAADLAGQLARATLLEHCGDEDGAGREFERLHREYPGDARPLGHLARRAFGEGDLAAARRHIAGAAQLQHQDTMCLLLAVLLELMPDGSGARPPESDAEAALARFERAVQGITRSEPAWAHVLRLLARSGTFAPPRPESTRQLLDRCGELFPAAEQAFRRHRSLPAYQLMLAWSLFCADHGRALRALELPLPERCGPQDALLRAQNWVALALGAGDVPAATLDAVLADLERDQQLPYDAALLRGTALALGAQRARRDGDFGAAIEALQAAVPPLGHPRWSRALNNLGTALFHAGKRDDALRAFQIAVDNASGCRQAMLNLLAILAGGDDDQGRAARARLRRFAAELDDDAALSALAWSWLGGLAERERDHDAARAACRNAVRALERRTHVNPRLPRLDEGVVAPGEWRWTIGVGSDGELELDLGVTLQLWLMVPPPLDEKQLRQRAQEH